MEDTVFLKTPTRDMYVLPTIHLTDGIFFCQCFASLLFRTWILVPAESHLLKLFLQKNVPLSTVRHNSSQSATYSAKFISKLLGTERNH